MGLSRRVKFEEYFSKDSRKVRSLEGLVDLLVQAFVWVAKEIDRIEKYAGIAASADTGTRTVITPSSGITVVGGSPAKTASLIAGSTSQRVNFSKTIKGAFILNWRCYNGAGESVGVTILETSIDSNGFTVTYCDSDCTIAYTTTGVL